MTTYKDTRKRSNHRND